MVNIGILDGDITGSVIKQSAIMVMSLVAMTEDNEAWTSLQSRSRHLTAENDHGRYFYLR